MARRSSAPRRRDHQRRPRGEAPHPDQDGEDGAGPIGERESGVHAAEPERARPGRHQATAGPGHGQAPRRSHQDRRDDEVQQAPDPAPQNEPLGCLLPADEPRGRRHRRGAGQEQQAHRGRNEPRGRGRRPRRGQAEQQRNRQHHPGAVLVWQRRRGQGRQHAHGRTLTNVVLRVWRPPTQTLSRRQLVPVPRSKSALGPQVQSGHSVHRRTPHSRVHLDRTLHLP
jgi:hypothetical protein